MYDSGQMQYDGDQGEGMHDNMNFNNMGGFNNGNTNFTFSSNGSEGMGGMDPN